MALLKTAEFLGIQPIPAATESGDLHEVFIKWDCAATANGAIASGDTIQLMRIPANAVISNVRVAQLSGTQVTLSAAIGVANASTAGVSPDAATTNSVTFNATAVPSLTAVSNSGPLVGTDVASSYNDRNLLVVTSVAGIVAGTTTLGFWVTYRPSRYGV